MFCLTFVPRFLIELLKGPQSLDNVGVLELLTSFVNVKHKSLHRSFLCVLLQPVPLSDPRWQLAPVTFLLPYSGQSSATYCRYAGVPRITSQHSARYRNRSGLLPLTPIHHRSVIYLHELLHCEAACRGEAWTPSCSGCEWEYVVFLETIKGTLCEKQRANGGPRSLWNIQAKRGE